MTDVALPAPSLPWTTLLAVYLVLLGGAAGIPMVASVVRPRERRAAQAVDRLASWSALALTAVAACVFIADLDPPTRFVSLVAEWSDAGSPLSVAAKLVLLELGLLALHLYLLPGGTRAGLMVAVLVAINGAALALVPGVLLARAWSSALATTAGAAALFLSTALAIGGAAALALAHTTPGVAGDVRFPERATRALTALLVLNGVLTIAFSQVPRGDRSPHTRALHELFGGNGAATFWLLVVLVGLAAPGVALWWRMRSRNAALAMAAAVTVGACAMRWLLFSLR